MSLLIISKLHTFSKIAILRTISRLLNFIARKFRLQKSKCKENNQNNDKMSSTPKHPKLTVAKILETNFSNYFLIYCASTIKRQTMKRNSEYN